MHTLLTPAMFNKNGVAVTKPPSASNVIPRKLKKSREDGSSSDLGDPTNSLLLSNSSPSNSLLPPSLGRIQQAYASGGLVNDPIRTIDNDFFGEVMKWSALHASHSAEHSVRSLASQSSDSHLRTGYITGEIHNPFGSGVFFDSPSTASPHPRTSFLPAPHMLREMQSFESGRTARQTDEDKQEHAPQIEVDISSRPLSIVSIARRSDLDGMLSPSPETAMHSPYPSDVFDIFQTYKGFPDFDKVLADPRVIKMSIEAESASPKDDPRFVIWGEYVVNPEADDLSASLDSLTDVSSSHSIGGTPSHTRSRRGKSINAADVPALRVPPGEVTQKVIIAATPERWLAQLTSNLNYEELLNFFLTYRHYLTSLDLLHMLISRFHWSLGQHTDGHDEMVRRIVRVRTFVAMRYWFMTFFGVDFIPNRELRLALADWVNTLIRDPVLTKHNDGLVSLNRQVTILLLKILFIFS